MFSLQTTFLLHNDMQFSIFYYVIKLLLLLLFVVVVVVVVVVNKINIL